MQMIEQDDERIDRERIILPRRGDRLAQASDLVDEQGCRRSGMVTVKKKHPPGISAHGSSACRIGYHIRLTGSGSRSGGLRLRLQSYGLSTPTSSVGHRLIRAPQPKIFGSQHMGWGSFVNPELSSQ